MIEIFGRISVERLVSVDAEINYLGALDFSPLRHSPAIDGFHCLVGTRRIIAHLLSPVRKIRYLNGSWAKDAQCCTVLGYISTSPLHDSRKSILMIRPEPEAFGLHGKYQGFAS